MLLSQHWTIGFSQNFPFEWLKAWVGIVREFLVLFWCLKMPLSAQFFPLSCKEVLKWLNFWGGQIPGSILQSVALFFESALFLISRLLKRGGQILFLRLEAFGARLWKLLISVVPSSTVSLKMLCADQLGCTIFSDFYWQCCFTLQPDNLGP